jgi:hypothetical protein
VAAAALTIWAPQISETNTLDRISRDDVADRAQVLVRREQKLQAITPSSWAPHVGVPARFRADHPSELFEFASERAADFSAALFVSGFGRFPQ